VKQHRGDRYQKQYECYSHPSFILAIEGCGFESEGGAHAVAVADFTSTIVVPLGSPIQPVAASKLEIEDTSQPLITGSWGVHGFKMVPVEPCVNSS
jgi:hypothetical protein